MVLSPFRETFLSPDVKVASDALMVLMVYQNRGYALMSY